MKNQKVLTHKEAVRRALEELGGRARLRDIYPRVIPYVKYKPGSDIRATLRRLLQTTPVLFRRTEGRKGWWELVSFQEELAARDRKIAELKHSQITKEAIIKGFNEYDTLTERIDAKQMMQLMFRGNAAWDDAYKEMKDAGYFKETVPQVILNNPQFRSLYEVTGNQEVKIGK
ncbi:MAG: hypothetical protein IJ588_07445 [Prevotella sp.]|nr:hypothetical protein [Prevotella sp.]